VTYFVGSKFGYLEWGGGRAVGGGGVVEAETDRTTHFVASILRFDKTPSSMTLTNIGTTYKFLPLDHPEHYRQNNQENGGKKTSNSSFLHFLEYFH
jgi:hypothetical protein